MEFPMLTKNNSIRLWWPVALILAACFSPSLLGQESLRRIHVGETMPEFALADANGTAVHYGGKEARVLAIVVLQARQSQFERLVTDIEVLVQTLRLETPAFDCVGVISGPGVSEYVRSRDPDARKAFPIFADPNFAFWGKLGVIAAPTAVVVGADHKVQWTKAGYGYDFVAGLHGQLSKALGLSGTSDTSAQVETLDNGSARARRDRHIQLGRALAKKGRLEPAIAELEKVREVDPNAVDVALELGEVLCRAGKNEAALKMASQIKAESNTDKARVMLISAWAERQMGDLDSAGSLLTKAIELDPESPRILYEAGKVHEARGDAEKALICYHKALAQIFSDGDVTSLSQK
jgi:Flp pilus assembly protein TadD